MSLAFVDIIMISICVISTLTGLWRGAIGLTVGLIFFCASLLLTYYAYPIATEWGANYTTSLIMQKFIGFCGAFFISSILCAVASWQIKSLLSSISGGGIDRLFGLIFGAIRGILLSLVLLIIMSVVFSGSYHDANNLLELVKIKDTKQPQWLKNWQLYPIAITIIDETVKVFGRDMEKIKLPGAKFKIDGV